MLSIADFRSLRSMFRMDSAIVTSPRSAKTISPISIQSKQVTAKGPRLSQHLEAKVPTDSGGRRGYLTNSRRYSSAGPCPRTQGSESCSHVHHTTESLEFRPCRRPILEESLPGRGRARGNYLKFPGLFIESDAGTRPYTSTSAHRVRPGRSDVFLRPFRP